MGLHFDLEADPRKGIGLRRAAVSIYRERVSLFLMDREIERGNGESERVRLLGAFSCSRESV